MGFGLGNSLVDRRTTTTNQHTRIPGGKPHPAQTINPHHHWNLAASKTWIHLLFLEKVPTCSRYSLKTLPSPVYHVPVAQILSPGRPEWDIEQQGLLMVQLTMFVWLFEKHGKHIWVHMFSPLYLTTFWVESNLFIVCLLFVLLGHDRPDTSLIVVFMASSSKRTADIYLQ